MLGDTLGPRAHGAGKRRLRQIALIATALVFIFVIYRVAFRETTPYTAGGIVSKRFSTDFEADKIQVLAWSPRVFLYKNFLSDEECEYIKKKGEPRLSRSKVVSRKGGDRISEARTSYGAFLSFMQDDPVLVSIEERIARWTHLPVENGEVFYLLRYELGQQYKPHHDYFHDEAYTKHGGNRVATVLMYLADVEEGGETVFPKINLEVPVNKGDAVLFFDYTMDGKPDPMSLHGGKPVIKGTKWCMTKWIRMGSARAT